MFHLPPSGRDAYLLAMTVLGMDTVAGLATGDQLENGSREIAALASRLEGLLHAFDWTGPDAERVRDSWSTTERPMLDRASQFVAALAALIRQEAQAQDAASDETVAPRPQRRRRSRLPPSIRGPRGSTRCCSGRRRRGCEARRSSGTPTGSAS